MSINLSASLLFKRFLKLYKLKKSTFCGRVRKDKHNILEKFVHMKRQGYKFTKKVHPKRAIMATILGAISLIALFAVIYISFLNNGASVASPGMTGLLITLFSIVGFGLAGVTFFEPERYLLFPILGITLNSLALIGISMVLYVGTL
ncbi:MAG: hypothetical protein J6U15_02005 [Lachnospiraceae bacterium]|nr:hypothetical protein [Lachnospiraceae bacterium]